MSLPTIAQMRTTLGLAPETSDAAVVDAYLLFIEQANVGPAEPLTLAEVKTNLKVTSTDEDALIEGLIVAAREHVEGFTGLVLTPRIVTETARELGRWIDLTSWPVTSITAIRYPAAGIMTALGTATWLVSYARRPVRVLPVSAGWGVGALFAGAGMLPVEIDVLAGYATPDDVPRPVKQAMHLLVAHWFSNRAASEVGIRAAAVEIPLGVDALLSRYRLRMV